MKVTKRELERFVTLGIADNVAVIDSNLYCQEYDILGISRNSVGTRTGVLLRFNNDAPEELAGRLFVAFGSDAFRY